MANFFKIYPTGAIPGTAFPPVVLRNLNLTPHNIYLSPKTLNYHECNLLGSATVAKDTKPNINSRN